VVRLLRNVFAFTDTEASLAPALRAGMSPPDYARACRVSINTVYTHLRHIKEKCRCQKWPALICRLNALRAAQVNVSWT
jgi:DNA-binding CsgD family transcriptional regulator